MRSSFLSVLSLPSICFFFLDSVLLVIWTRCFGDPCDFAYVIWTLKFLTIWTHVQCSGELAMSEYTPREYADMHLIYGECGCVGREAARVYRERYPNRRHPDHRVFARVHNAYTEGRIPGTGVGGASEGRPRVYNDEEILELVEEDPTTSVRTIARRTGISTRTVHRVLLRHELYPYHFQRVQSLLPRDRPLRVQFCREMLRRMREDPQFYDKILWSDESSCKKDGYFNMHNLHSWQLENPNLIRTARSQYQFKINLWTAIIGGQIIGPFELPETLNGERYLNFLVNDLPELMRDVDPQLRETMWLQNDGCPAHYAVIVRDHLHATYPERWIGRLGPMSWPPRSPDLNPLDFFYWGCLKEKVYKTEITSIDDLRQKIQYAAEEINASGFARRLKRSFIRRCRACIAANGGHFEHIV